ncbi:hypothetical protein C8N34_14310, partial [Gemmobacter caeni]
MRKMHISTPPLPRLADLSTVSLLAIEAGLKRREALALEMRNVPGD